MPCPRWLGGVPGKRSVWGRTWGTWRSTPRPPSVPLLVGPHVLPSVQVWAYVGETAAGDKVSRG